MDHVAGAPAWGVKAIDPLALLAHLTTDIWLVVVTLRHVGLFC